ncbi:hypothetical protein [Okeania sp. SIO2B3]|nr:hypothetical protein [Okeania sp. SIO2B3]NET44491.1 hypothetical protein [Okeania sp. SIO2B3]
MHLIICSPTQCIRGWGLCETLDKVDFQNIWNTMRAIAAFEITVAIAL